MALYTEQSYQNYTGNGSTKSYPIPFPFFDNAHIHVTVNAVPLVYGAAYTVVGQGNPGGGTVTFQVAPGSGSAVRVQRITPRKQLLDLVTQGQFMPEALESALDCLEMQIQELNDGAASYSFAQHGVHTDPTLHGLATRALHGFMPSFKYVQLEDHVAGLSDRHTVAHVQGLQELLDLKLFIDDLLIENIPDLQAELDGKSPIGHNHDGRYSFVNHNHDTRYSLLSHNHDTRYALIAHTHPAPTWVSITGKPNTLAGYNIIDGVTITTHNTLANLVNNNHSPRIQDLENSVARLPVADAMYEYDGSKFVWVDGRNGGVLPIDLVPTGTTGEFKAAFTNNMPNDFFRVYTQCTLTFVGGQPGLTCVIGKQTKSEVSLVFKHYELSGAVPRRVYIQIWDVK